MSTSTSGAALVDRGFLRLVAILSCATCAFLLAATTAAASVVPSRNATTVATAVTDALGAGELTAASFPIIPPAPDIDVECSNGVDDDFDGLIDFTPPAGETADPDCSSAADNREQGDPLPECSNGFDDDGDGLIDFTPPAGETADPDCSSAADNREQGDPLPECSNGFDDDFDGLIDFTPPAGETADPDCSSAADTGEQGDPLPECSNGFDDDFDGLIDFTPPAGETADPGCSSAQDNNEVEGEPDPTPECSNGFDDDFDGLIDFTPPVGETADPDCSSAADLGEQGDPLPECSNGFDDDGDGLIDFTPPAGETADPDCSSAADTGEQGDPLPECSNGFDDDGDDKVDFTPPGGETADPGCSSAADLDEGSEGLPPGEDTNPAAVGDSVLAGFPTSGATYAILSSGNTNFADDPNNSSGTSQSNGNGPGSAAHGDNVRDLVQLKVDLNVPAGRNCLSLDFRFLSEEFPEYVGSAFNDGFVAELDTSDFQATSDAITAPNNFAFDSLGDVISINTTGASGFSEAEAAGTTYDGATPRLRARTPITPGAHSVYLSVFDVGDSALDSAAFVDELVVYSAPAGSCVSGSTADLVPPAVTLVNPADGSTTTDSTPTYDGSAGTAAGDSTTVTVKIYAGATATGSPVQTLTTTQSGGSWTVDGSPALGDGTYTAQAEQSDSAGNTGQSAPHTFTIDTPPDTIIDSAAHGTTSDTTPSFAFHSTEAGSTFECSIDTGTASFGPCSGPGATHTPASPLADGAYTFRVRATDSDGTPNTDASPATEAFTVSTVVDTPPDTIIDSAAHGTTSDTTPSFAFHSTEAGSTFECSIDTGTASFGPCSGPGATHTPASPLAAGAYTFRVRATDSDGTPNTDPSPATETFTVDTPPDTIIDSAAHGTTSDTTPSFAFHSTEAGSTFECSIDTGTASFGPCSGPGATHTPASPLADGAYTFRVRATDSDGTPNTDASPATEAFTVSTVVDTPPDTIIDSAAHGTTSDTTPSFAFHSTEAGSTFECSIDTGTASFGPCSGPGATHTPASPLADGAYTFRVRATDSDGTPNTDASPATEAFTVSTVVDTPPDTIIDSAAHGTTSDTTPSFAFHSTEAGSTFECSIDTGTASFGPCSGPGATHTPASPLAAGAYTFRVRATDSDGTPNTDASPATQAFTVSTVVVPPTPTPECDGQTATIVGTEGNDVLNGTKRADVIVGLGGKDQINAKKGNDLVCAGAGKDHVVGGPGADDLFGEGGDDLLNGNKGADRLNGGAGEDRCNGGSGHNTRNSCEH